MQQINTDRQQANSRLPRQLPASIIKETTLPSHRKHDNNNNSKSATNGFDQLTGESQRQSQLRRLQTDLGDFDTHRSLSSCPTYSSLSRHSPETRECATQITTLTPTEPIEDNQDISDDSPLSIDNNQVLLVDEIPFEEVELMPVASGFGYYPYNYPTTRTDRVVQPQIVARAPQFRNNQRDKNQNGLISNSKTKLNGKSPSQRPTAVKQSPRSDTFASSTKQNDINAKNNPPQNVSRRIPPKEPAVRNSSPAPEKRRSERIRKDGIPHQAPKYLSSPDDQRDLGRKPLRFPSKNNNAYYPSSSAAYYQQPAPLPRDTLDRPNRMRVANNEYVIRRRRQEPPDYVYDDYYPDSPIERTRPRRVVRVLRDAPYRDDDDDDGYYVEPVPSRRAPIVRRPPPVEYVYVDEPPAQIRPRRSRRPEVVYVDDDQPVEYEAEYIYVDENGHEVDFVNGRKHSPEAVEYVYDDDKDRRRSHNSKVVYVEDDAPINQGRNKKKSNQPSSTRIVYE